jgi:hypothetical protein
MKLPPETDVESFVPFGRFVVPCSKIWLAVVIDGSRVSLSSNGSRVGCSADASSAGFDRWGFDDAGQADGMN